MKVMTMSMAELREFRHDKDWALISIGTPGNLIPDYCAKKQAAMLRLEFHDNNVDRDEDIMAGYDSEVVVPFTTKMAQEAWNFVYALLFNYQIDLLVVQCEFGMNRSVGLAAGINKCLFGNGATICRGKIPNMTVYKKMVDVHKNSSNKQESK